MLTEVSQQDVSGAGAGSMLHSLEQRYTLGGAISAAVSQVRAFCPSCAWTAVCLSMTDWTPSPSCAGHWQMVAPSTPSHRERSGLP